MHAAPAVDDGGIVDPAPDTEVRLLAAAATVFAEKGYDKAGVSEIARRAGLTTGAIYSRFSGKAELLAAAVAGCVPDEFDQLFADHAFDRGAQDILRTVGAHLVTREPTPMQGVLLEAFVAARRDPEVRDVLWRQFADRRRRLALLVEAGQEAGVVDPDLDVGAVVHFAHAVGLGFLLYEAIGAPHPDPSQWEDVVSRVVTALDPTASDPTDPTDPLIEPTRSGETTPQE